MRILDMKRNENLPELYQIVDEFYMDRDGRCYILFDDPDVMNWRGVPLPEQSCLKISNTLSKNF